MGMPSGGRQVLGLFPVFQVLLLGVTVIGHWNVCFIGTLWSGLCGQEGQRRGTKKEQEEDGESTSDVGESTEHPRPVLEGGIVGGGGVWDRKFCITEMAQCVLQ